MNSRQKLIDQIEEYLKTTGISATKFGKDALNDSAFVFRLRSGGDVTLNSADKLRKFMDPNDFLPDHTSDCGEAA